MFSINSASSNKETGPVPQKLTAPPQIKTITAISCIMNLWFFNDIFIVLSLTHPFLGLQFHEVFTGKLIMFHSKEFNEAISCRSRASFLLNITKLLKTSLDSTSIFSIIIMDSAGKRSLNPIHCDGCNLMPSRVNIFDGLLDVMIFQNCPEFATDSSLNFCLISVCIHISRKWL